MGVNKVMAKGEVVLDLTQDTVTPYTLATGAIAHDAAGDQIIGVGGLNVSAIDDTAGDGDYDVAWSADKVYNELSDIKSTIATGGVHNEGAWSAETSYTKFAAVTHSGSSYLALEDVPAGTSLSNTNYWLRLANAGGAENIDDTAGAGDTTVTWSADKISGIDAELYKQKLENGNVLYFFPKLKTNQYGLSGLVVTKTKTLLFDTNPSNIWEIEKDWLDDLYSNGIFTNIDYVIISHYHYDHVGNFSSILDRYPHDNCEVYIPLDASNYKNSSFSSQTAMTEFYNSIVNYCNTNNIDYTEISEDTVLTISQEENIDLTLWNSTIADYTYYKTCSGAVYNDYSMIGIFRHGNVKTLFSGDIQVQGQKRILSQHNVPKVWMWTWPHHGHENKKYEPFWQCVSPDYSVVPRGRDYWTDLSVMPETILGNIDINSDITFLRYSPCVFVSDKTSGIKIDGKTINVKGENIRKDIYVDNEHVDPDDIYDGSEEHPFKEISEAVRLLSGKEYEVNIKVKATSTKYARINIYNNTTTTLYITGVESNGQLPFCDYINLYGVSGRLFISNIIFNGTENRLASNNKYYYGYISNCNNIAFNNCTFDASGVTTYDSSTKGIRSNYSRVTISNCTCNSIYYCFDTYTYGEFIFTGTNNFIDCSYIIYQTPMKIVLSTGNFTVSGATRTCKFIMTTGSDKPLELIVNKSYDLSILTDNGGSSGSMVSSPFFYSSTYPAVVLVKDKIIDLFTGDQVYPETT